MRAQVIAALALVVLAGSVEAQDFKWHAAMASGKTLEIRGVSGRVRATRATGSEAEVTAVKKAGRKGDPDDVEIKVVEDGDGVTICAVYPTRRSRSGDCRAGGGSDENYRDTDVEVNFEVRVPSGVDFIGVTVNGDVYASDLPADAEVTTVNGDVEASAAGVVKGSTVNGSVDVKLGKVWTGTLHFSTVNGGITVTLPADLDADIDATTVNGSVDSDFPITVQGKMRRGGTFHGTIGKGGRRLELNTVNGSIELRKS